MEDTLGTTDLTKTCQLCGNAIERSYQTSRDLFSYRCPVCGNVDISPEAVLAINRELRSLKHLLSGFTRERTELQLPPIIILSSNAKELASGANIPKNISDKLDQLLLYFERESDFPGKTVKVVTEREYPIAYAKNAHELLYLLKQLESLEWIGHVTVTGEVDGYRQYNALLTVDGWNRLAELHRHHRITDQAFVAMWFTSETEGAYKDGIERAINESGFRPLRVDKLEHNNKICDLIIAEIRKSAFLVADFTGHRGGVYFEAGFALGLGIPVIWLCRKDEIDQAHFDTRQYNHIVWENEAELYSKLLNRINATIVR